MFSWLSRDKKNRSEVEAYTSVLDGLQRCYYRKLKPLEDSTFFGEFHSPALTTGDFMAKPMVLLIGQYSTGKTSFIKYLLEQVRFILFVGWVGLETGWRLIIFSHLFRA